jgi:hypothetical protein
MEDTYLVQCKRLCSDVGKPDVCNLYDLVLTE